MAELEIFCEKKKGTVHVGVLSVYVWGFAGVVGWSWGFFELFVLCLFGFFRSGWKIRDVFGFKHSFKNHNYAVYAFVLP